MITIGVISDTHGLLRPEAINALRGSDAIVHAGDVGEESIIPELERIAPVTAVRGNVDTSGWCRTLPQANVLEVNGATLYVLHRLEDLDLDAKAAGLAAVIFGHSHQPLIEWRNDVLFFNPGSAGPRRFSLPISLGKLILRKGKLEPEIIPLQQ